MDNSRSESKVRKIKQPFKINAGLIVFAFIFIYISVYVIIYFTKEHVALYEVVEKSISENNSFTALAIREEEVINADAAGYITFYQSNGERVAVNDLVFSINEGGSAFEKIEETYATNDLSDSDYLKVQEELNYFKKRYKDATFDNSYDFKNNISNLVLELNNNAVYDDLEAIITSVGEDNLVINKSSKTGVVAYTIDGMEATKIDDVTNDMFDESGYKYTDISTGKLLEKDAPAYKLITSEDWELMVPLTSDQYERVKEKTRIGMTFTKNNFFTYVNITTTVKDDKYYAILSLDRYMVNYINERYIDIELQINTATGLKIPNTAIVDKEFYVIPKNLFTQGGNSDSLGLAIMTYSDNGELNTEFISTDIYYETETDYYVDENLFDVGTQIYDSVNGSQYNVTEKALLTGVYNVNKGYCEFRKIEVLYSTEEYSIVKKGSEEDYSLAKYDHIILDASLAVEQEIIY